MKYNHLVAAALAAMFSLVLGACAGLEPVDRELDTVKVVKSDRDLWGDSGMPVEACRLFLSSSTCGQWRSYSLPRKLELLASSPSWAAFEATRGDAYEATLAEAIRFGTIPAVSAEAIRTGLYGRVALERCIARDEIHTDGCIVRHAAAASPAMIAAARKTIATARYRTSVNGDLSIETRTGREGIPPEGKAYWANAALWPKS